MLEMAVLGSTESFPESSIVDSRTGSRRRMSASAGFSTPCSSNLESRSNLSSAVIARRLSRYTTSKRCWSAEVAGES